MIRHVVAFRFKESVSPETLAGILDELNGFPATFPQMQRWSLGPNISRRDQSMTHAFSVDFDSEELLLDYLGSERHETFIRERWVPVIEERVIVTYEF